MSDVGFTHVALEVNDIDLTISFYAKYAGMKLVHRRSDNEAQTDVAWLSDLTRPFVIVLLKVPQVNSKLLPQSHLGVAYETRESVDRLCQQAQSENLLIEGPNDWGPPVGYWAYIRDPNGHTLEISYGQKVSFTVQQAANSPDVTPNN